MRKFLPIVCFLGFFSIATLLHCYIVTNAQTSDYQKAYQDYLASYNLYRDSHLSYQTAKNEYLAYRTLNAETKAFEATREMLQKRDEVLQAYFRALRSRLEETTGITNYRENLSYVKLDSEIGWLSTHKDSIRGASSIEDLINISSQLEEKYPSLEVLTYQTLGTIISARENSLKERVSTQTEKIAGKINQMKSEGENVEKLQRWLSEAKKKISLSSEKQTEAELKIKEIEVNDSDKLSPFNEAQTSYKQSNQYLKEAIAYLAEIVEEIKYGQ